VIHKYDNLNSPGPQYYVWASQINSAIGNLTTSFGELQIATTYDGFCALLPAGTHAMMGGASAIDRHHKMESEVHSKLQVRLEFYLIWRSDVTGNYTKLVWLILLLLLH